MKSIIRYFSCISAAALILLAVGSASAGESVVEVNSVTLISSPGESETRILAMPELPLEATGIVIDRVLLCLSVEPQTEDTSFIPIRAYALGTEWSPGTVAWDSPWEEDGGDIDEDTYAECLVTVPETQDVAIDITDLYGRWLDGRLPYYGFMLALSPSALDDFTIVRENDSGPYATIVIQYSPTPTE